MSGIALDNAKMGFPCVVMPYAGIQDLKPSMELFMNTPGEHAIPINPALLSWARESAGLSLAEAAVRAKIAPLKQKK